MSSTSDTYVGTDLSDDHPISFAYTSGLAASDLQLVPPAALAQGAQNVLDLTHVYSPEFPTYFGAPGVAMEQGFNFEEHGFNLFTLTLNEHTGTHIDAPLHFSADGQSLVGLGFPLLPLRWH